jgi:hypothetical protein
VNIDAYLAGIGLDRATIEAELDSLAVDEEKDAPNVAQARRMLEEYKLTRERTAEAIDDPAETVEIERLLENQVLVHKVRHVAMHTLMNGTPDKPNCVH